MLQQTHLHRFDRGGRVLRQTSCCSTQSSCKCRSQDQRKHIRDRVSPLGPAPGTQSSHRSHCPSTVSTDLADPAPRSQLRGTRPSGHQTIEATAHLEDDPATPKPRLSNRTTESPTKPSTSVVIFDPGVLPASFCEVGSRGPPFSMTQLINLSIPPSLLISGHAVASAAPAASYKSLFHHQPWTSIWELSSSSSSSGFSAVDCAHHLLCIARSRGRAGRERVIDPLEVLLRQPHLKRANVLLKILAALGAVNRNNVLALRQYPSA